MIHRRAALAFALTMLLPVVAGAHLVTTGLGPFYDGVTHFASTAEDLIPALGVALLAGLRGSRSGRWALFAFPSTWFLGGLAGLLGPALGHSLLLSSLTFLAAGSLVALDAKLDARWVVMFAAAIGVLHGYLNGNGLREAGSGTLELVGIVASLFVLVSLMTALVASLRAAWTRVAVRVAGSWIVASGLLLLGWSFRK